MNDDLELFRAREAVAAAACNGDRFARERQEQRTTGVLPLRNVCRIVQGFDGTPRLVIL